ncbi:MAG: hypothetical protein KBB33_02955 [Candidatus Cloacimonetes bacterium]|nr:hypothetical protein [Candidatus Cloacimonadota bacterium]
MKRLLSLLLLCLILPLSAELKQSLFGADSLSIGSVFELKLETDFRLKEVVIPDSLKEFRILQTDIGHEDLGSTALLKIMVLNTGALSFPKLGLLAVDPDVGDQSTDAFRIHVLATRAENDTLLRDLKPPLRLPFELPFWLYLIIGLVCLTLAVWLLMTARPKKAKIPVPVAEKPGPLPIPIPAWKKALAALDALQQSALAETDLLEYHYRLSQILRSYLEDNYRFNAMEMTTSEIRRLMREVASLNAPEALSILDYCDRVKFAKEQVSTQQITLQTQALQLYLLREGGLSGL